MSKGMGILSNFGFYTMPAHQIWSCHVTQDANFEHILFFSNSTLNIRKSKKFLVEKLSTSEVISQKPHGSFHPPPPKGFRVNNASLTG